MRYRDPVCGMDILWEEAWATQLYRGRRYYLCCPGCTELFALHAERFTGARDGGVPVEAAFVVGSTTLDGLDAMVRQEWGLRLGSSVCPFSARTLQRCMLSLVLGDPARRPEVERRMAAELVRLRDPALDLIGVLRALRRLPGSIAAAGRRARIQPSRTASACAQTRALLRQMVRWSRTRADAGDPVHPASQRDRATDAPACPRAPSCAGALADAAGAIRRRGQEDSPGPGNGRAVIQDPLAADPP